VREFELRFAPWTTPSRNGGVATFQDRTARARAFWLVRAAGARVRGTERLRARVWARVRARRKPRQDGTGVAVFGSVASSCPACPAETEEIKSWRLATAGRGGHLASGQGSRPGLAQSLLLKS